MMKPTSSRDTILLIDDDDKSVASIEVALSAAGFDVRVAKSCEEAQAALRTDCVDLVLVDKGLGLRSEARFLTEIHALNPELPCIVTSDHPDVETVLKAMRAGAIDMVLKPFEKPDLLKTVRRNLASNEAWRVRRRERWQIEQHTGAEGIIGRSQGMLKVLEWIRRVSATDATVLIEGETGVGKELVANAIHRGSSRRNRELVTANVGALPPTLLESTLFGFVKGSFTGAHADRPGLFYSANGTTLFLDEIGEATADVQVRLLRVLDEGSITRVGETGTRKVDVRLITATNRDLRKEVDRGRFRRDLFYRLNVTRIRVPPLRERIDDIEPIALRFLEDANRRHGRCQKRFHRDVIETLQRYRWPGNVRELQNVIESAVICSASDTIMATDLEVVQEEESDWNINNWMDLTYDEARRKWDRSYFRHVIERADGNKSQAATLARMDRSTFIRYLKKIGLDK